MLAYEAAWARRHSSGDGFSRANLSSIKTIYEEIEPKLMEKNEISPLLELELVAPTIEWQPDLGEASSGDGVRDAFNSWIKGFLSVGTLMKRLDMTKWIFLYCNYVHL